MESTLTKSICATASFSNRLTQCRSSPTLHASRITKTISETLLNNALGDLRRKAKTTYKYSYGTILHFKRTPEDYHRVSKNKADVANVGEHLIRKVANIRCLFCYFCYKPARERAPSVKVHMLKKEEKSTLWCFSIAFEKVGVKIVLLRPCLLSF